MFLQKLFRFVPRSPLRRALTHLNRGEHQQALDLLEDILADEASPPDDIAAYAVDCLLHIGRERSSRHDRVGALRAYERAAALRPGFADIQMQLAQVYEQNDRTSEARAAYERALAINPRYFEARLGLARLLLQQNETTEALQHMEEAAQHGPEHAREQVRAALHGAPQAADGTSDEDTHRPRACGEAMSARRFEPLFEALLQRTQPQASDGITRAREALRTGDNRTAIAALKQLLREHSHYPDLHNLLGVAYDNEDMVDDAIEEFEQALYLNPLFVDARVNLGLTLFGRGRYAEADHHLQWVARRRPDHKLVQSVLSQIAARGVAH